ncbi:MAG: glycosyltransferase family 2 protein [bacterium]|nr:glycosyltransferase family 2 protein [Candidatus Sumerlaeota bacterium]
MILSIVIPAHNEEGSIRETVENLEACLTEHGIPREIIVVNDHSTDGTAAVLSDLATAHESVRWIDNTRYPGGFGYAVRTGLEDFRGDAACIVMADSSDDPADVVVYYQKLEEGYDCVFGSRFTPKSRVSNYPVHKLVLNRIANLFIRMLFCLSLNDTTNAFKCYHRRVIEGVQPILSCHFNLTVELPLKAVVRGFKYTVVPINWYGRKSGVSKLKIKEMGSRYLFIVLYVLLEKWLSRGDYRLQKEEGQQRIQSRCASPARTKTGALLPVPSTSSPGISVSLTLAAVTPRAA